MSTNCRLANEYSYSRSSMSSVVRDGSSTAKRTQHGPTSIIYTVQYKKYFLQLILAEQHILRCGKGYGRFDGYRMVAAKKKLVALKKNQHAVTLTKKNVPPSRKVSQAKRKGLPTKRPQMQKSSQVRKKSQQVVKSKTTGKGK